MFEVIKQLQHGGTGMISHDSHAVVFGSKNRSVVCHIILFFFGLQGSFIILPFCLLSRQEVVQVLDNVLKAAQPSTELFLNTGLVVTELGVKVLTVGSCAHGGTEDGLNHETVVLAKGVSVCGTERDADFLVAVGQVLAKSLGGEVESTNTWSIWFCGPA